MKRYEQMFRHCEEQNRIAFIPFVMIGDPDFDASLKIVRQLIVSGADALELGVAFSDPVADGPVIQKAALRPLNADMTLSRSFEFIKQIRQEFPEIPIGLLLYANLVVHYGIDDFYGECDSVGVDSVLIAAVPLRESETFDKAATNNSIQPVYILPPNASDQTLKNVSGSSQGYTYVLGRKGVTGTEQAAHMPENDAVAQLTELGAAPPVIGFGISKPEHVIAAGKSGFKGAISGSAVVKLLENYRDNESQCLKQLALFVEEMQKATYTIETESGS